MTSLMALVSVTSDFKSQDLHISVVYGTGFVFNPGIISIGQPKDKRSATHGS